MTPRVVVDNRRFERKANLLGKYPNGYGRPGRARGILLSAVKRLLVAFVALAAVAVAAALAGNVGAGSTPATIRIVSRAPLAVSGAHFRANERVRVTAVASRTLTRTVLANRVGTFTAQFTTQFPVDRCSGLIVRAAGSRGTLAVAKLPQPMCMPQRAP